MARDKLKIRKYPHYTLHTRATHRELGNELALVDVLVSSADTLGAGLADEPRRSIRYIPQHETTKSKHVQIIKIAQHGYGFYL